MSQYLEKKERDKCEGNKRNLKMKQNKTKQTPPKQYVYTVNHQSLYLRNIKNIPLGIFRA